VIADEFDRILPAFLEVDESGVVRLGMDQIEELLGRILRKRFPVASPHLFEGTGLLADLGARIHLAYATSVIDGHFANTLYVVADLRYGHWLRRFVRGEWTGAQLEAFTALFERCGVPMYGPGRIKPEVGFGVVRRLLAVLVANLLKVYREVEPIDSSAAHPLLHP
jgi:hypothetical protein